MQPHFGVSSSFVKWNLKFLSLSGIRELKKLIPVEHSSQCLAHGKYLMQFYFSSIKWLWPLFFNTSLLFRRWSVGVPFPFPPALRSCSPCPGSSVTACLYNKTVMSGKRTNTWVPKLDLPVNGLVILGKVLNLSVPVYSTFFIDPSSLNICTASLWDPGQINTPGAFLDFPGNDRCCSLEGRCEDRNMYFCDSSPNWLRQKLVLTDAVLLLQIPQNWDAALELGNR